jgi:hypothetical protein
MTPHITNAMRVQISAASATLLPSVRDQFYRSVMRALASGPQPPTMNCVLRSIHMALEMVPASSTVISRSVGASTNDSDDRRRRRIY